jgi:hypothetical protein
MVVREEAGAIILAEQAATGCLEESDKYWETVSVR